VVAFLIAALALPPNPLADYMLLKAFIEKRRPHYEIVFINEGEKLLNPGAEDTRISTVNKDRSPGLRLWLIREGA
jgi:hypothetical protein